MSPEATSSSGPEKKARLTTQLTLQVLEQAAVPHELGNDVDRLLDRADSVQLYELAVPQFLHDLGLGQEVLGVHGAGLEGLDGDAGRVVPESLPDLAELALAELADELEGGLVDLPLVPGAMAQALGHRFLHLDEGTQAKCGHARGRSSELGGHVGGGI